MPPTQKRRIEFENTIDGFLHLIGRHRVETDAGLFRFGDHAFRIGEYVSIKEHDDVMRTFRVVSVT